MNLHDQSFNKNLWRFHTGISLIFVLFSRRFMTLSNSKSIIIILLLK